MLIRRRWPEAAVVMAAKEERGEVVQRVKRLYREEVGDGRGEKLDVHNLSSFYCY